MRAKKWSASRIAFELRDKDIKISRRTVSRHLALGLNRRKFIDPTGDANREPRKIIARRLGLRRHLTPAALRAELTGMGFTVRSLTGTDLVCVWS